MNTMPSPSAAPNGSAPANSRLRRAPRTPRRRRAGRSPASRMTGASRTPAGVLAVRCVLLRFRLLFVFAPGSARGDERAHNADSSASSPNPGESPTERSNSRFLKTFFNGRPGTAQAPAPSHLTSPSLPSLHAGAAADDARTGGGGGGGTGQGRAEGRDRGAEPGAVRGGEPHGRGRAEAGAHRAKGGGARGAGDARGAKGGGGGEGGAAERVAAD
ncbi:hypothetical protein B0H17DRAFT_342991 [Mycena rosella]|uniref:Uncharacterized protein n=1 Tax=Mycena rosella TaxID=1033263 RepID=A0AAD7G5Z8_MYCRO|nr:hypothetical protein B0H17DRAFT_342991 [Mycena rosella]